MSDKLKTLITLLGFALLVLVVVRSGDDRFALQKQAEAHFEQGDAYLEIEVEPTWYVVVGKHTLPSGQTIVAGYSEKHGPQSMRFPALADSSLAWLRPGDKFLRSTVSYQLIVPYVDHNLRREVPVVEYVYGTGYEEAMSIAHGRSGA
ncbi:MAG TPA: hypothetical protein VJJ24_03400 [Candidatus Paceibacterota bacterium]